MMKNSSQISKPTGLPNIGNTCFMNSVLQQLYQIDPIRDCLRKLGNLVGKSDQFVIQLNLLFETMKSEKFQYNDLYTILLNLLHVIQDQLHDYTFGDHSDSFQFFLLILNHLFQREQHLSKFFEITFNHVCSCQARPLLMKEVTLQIEDFKCLTCMTMIKRNYFDLPQYLIVKYGKYERRRVEDDLILKIFGNKTHSSKKQCPEQDKNVCYQLLSKNIYLGNGFRGHYYAECLYNAKIYEFDDSYVRQKYKRSFQVGSCLFAIYKKVRKIDINGFNHQELQKKSLKEVVSVRKSPSQKYQLNKNQKQPTFPKSHHIDNNGLHPSRGKKNNQEQYQTDQTKKKVLNKSDLQQIKNTQSYPYSTYSSKNQHLQKDIASKKAQKVITVNPSYTNFSFSHNTNVKYEQEKIWTNK